jgi:hypothetical protein
VMPLIDRVRLQDSGTSLSLLEALR